MLDLNPYLHFAGNAAESMNFYKKVFRGEFLVYSRYKDLPGGEKMPEADQQKFVHIALSIGKGHTLMATDIITTMGHDLNQGNSYHICIEAESEEEIERLFRDLSEGGKIEMPLNKTFWGAYFGMFRDRFGVQWMINYTYPKP
jgi:PhnB protein